MTDQKQGAIVGAIGGGGAATGGIIGVIYEGDLILGLLLAVAAGGILSGTALLYFSHRTN